MKKINLMKIVILTLILSFSVIGCKKSSTTEFSVEEIKKLSELRTLECTFKTVADIEDKAILGVLGTRKYFVQYNAKIVVGVDVRKIEYDEGKKTLYIPKAEIVFANYDTSSIDEKDKNAFLFFSIDQARRNSLLSESLEELKKNVVDNEYLLRQGQQLAENQIRAIVNELYTIAGKEPDLTYALK